MLTKQDHKYLSFNHMIKGDMSFLTVRLFNLYRHANTSLKVLLF